MSNEITITSNFSLTNGESSMSIEKTKQVDQTAVGFKRSIITLSTSDTVVDLTGLTTPRFAILHNLDPTNAIQFGPTASAALAPFGEIKAGDPPIIVPLVSGVVLRVKASAGTPQLDITITEH